MQNRSALLHNARVRTACPACRYATSHNSACAKFIQNYAIIFHKLRIRRGSLYQDKLNNNIKTKIINIPIEVKIT